jgi:hypothetical protein
MPANHSQLQIALKRPYNQLLFSKEVLSPIFGSNFRLNSSVVVVPALPTKKENTVINKATIYGNITLDDGTEINCFEVELQPHVKIEHSKVAIQQYVRKLLITGQAALINFVTPSNNDVWRFTLIAKDSIITDDGIKEKTTSAKRYTYLLGPNETCRTAAERFEALSIEKQSTFENLIKAFSVEKLSKAFFDEYTLHYKRFISYLSSSDYRISAFHGDEKAIRDFVKKLLGRIVFLYFVQKKGWLGATSKEYLDGDSNFIFNLFKDSGGDDAFYPKWLSVLFFDTLNQDGSQNEIRKDDNFLLPNGKIVKIPFLNGGLFDKEEQDQSPLTFNSLLFHNPDNDDDAKYRGFLDFLNSFNFTVFEDSPDDHTIAVDPEMLGHIFENLLEDNKDKGAFYTPKQIVHFMCQESLIEYLTSHLSKEYLIYKQIGDEQVELFGNETRTGQLKMVEALGNKALNRDDVAFIVTNKNISKLTREQLERMSQLLDTIKICDPAIGSGAFPMGLLQEIYTIKEVIAYETGVDWKPVDVKENIIQNSIYGVDIEKGAVDIARLRFWLSIVVDEDKPQPLPNLDYKITVGNSLLSKFDNQVIEIDWVPDSKGTTTSIQNKVALQRTLLKQLVDAQRKYFHAKGKDKSLIANDINNLKCDILVNQLGMNQEQYKNSNMPQESLMPTAKEVLKKNAFISTLKDFETSIYKIGALKSIGKSLDFFDWKLNFPEVLNDKLVESATGFDIVIANPPYIQLQSMKEEADLLQKGKFKTFIRTGDIYSLFYELGCNILKPKGILTYITSNKWMRAAYGESLRNFFINYTNPLLLIDFGGYQVFETATVDTNIIVLKKEDNQKYIKTCVLNKGLKSLNKMSDFIRQSVTVQGGFKLDEAWVILSPVEASIKSKIEALGKPLKDWDVNIYRGILTGYNEAFMIDEKTKRELIEASPKNGEIIRPILRGRDIAKYEINFADLWLICSHNGIKDKGINRVDLEKDYPTIFSHIEKYKAQLIKRSDKGDHWSNLRNCAYLDIFDGPKILYPETMRIHKNEPTHFPRFSYDEGNFICDKTVFAITGNDLLYLLAFLNSKSMGFLLPKYVTAWDDGGFMLQKVHLENIPIPELPSENKNSIIELSLTLLKSEKTEHPKLLEKIDSYFYEYINLNANEISFVDNFHVSDFN